MSEYFPFHLLPPDLQDLKRTNPSQFAFQRQRYLREVEISRKKEKARMSSRSSIKTYAPKYGRSEIAAARLAEARAASRAAVAARGRKFGAPSAPAKTVNDIKGMDTPIEYSPIIDTTNTNAGIFPVNLVRAGAGDWNRVGRKIYLRSVRVKGILTWNVNTSDGTVFPQGFARMSLIWDQQPTGTIPKFDDIYGTTDQAGAEACGTIMEGLKFDNMQRFRTIREWVVEANPIAPCITSTSTPIFGISNYSCPVDEYVKLNNLESRYGADSSPMTIADVSNGALYLIMRWGEGAAGIGDFSGSVRIRYSN